MSKIKNGGLDQYVTEPFEQQHSGTAGGEGVKQPYSRGLLYQRWRFVTARDCSCGNAFGRICLSVCLFELML